MTDLERLLKNASAIKKAELLNRIQCFIIRHNQLLDYGRRWQGGLTPEELAALILIYTVRNQS